MYVMYYASMLQCWQLIRILVKTNHPCSRVGCHKIKLAKYENGTSRTLKISKLCIMMYYLKRDNFYFCLNFQIPLDFEL
jgi:hypothetical protein